MKTVAINGYGTATQNPTPGFSFKIPKENLSDGKHTIKINVVKFLMIVLPTLLME